MAKRIESPSSINTFKQCKRKYYYQYIEKLPTVANIHQIRGNIAHSTLEKFYDIDISEFTLENYELKFKETIQRLLSFHWKSYHPKLKDLKLNSDQEMFYFEETMLMLMNWTNHFLLDMKRIMEERKILISEAFHLLTPIRESEFTSQTHSVHGFVDAIHQYGDEIHIIDYKTNSTFEFKDSIKLQLGIYSLLYQETHAKMPSKVGIFFLRQKLKMMKVDEELLELARKEIESVHAHTSSTERKEEYTRTKSGLCKWSSGQCDFYNVCKPHEVTVEIKDKEFENEVSLKR